MAHTKYDDQLELKQKEALLLEEQIGLLQRVREIELEIANFVVTKAQNAAVQTRRAAPVASPATNGVAKRRGRPKGSKNVRKDKTLVLADGQVVEQGDDGKSIDLPSLLETIAQQVDRPLLLADFVTLAREAGYTTKAKDFSNMVYQAVLKLVKKGLFKKNDETRAYEYVGQVAA